MISKPMCKSHKSTSVARHLLFIDEQMELGGIAVLIARLSRMLLRDGWRVTLLVRVVTPGAKAMLPTDLEIHELAGQFKWMNFPGLATRIARKYGFDDVTFIYATGVVATWLGTILSTALPQHPRVLCAAYTQREYCYPKTVGLSSYGDYLRAENFDRNVPDVSKLFQSNVVRDSHARSFGRVLNDSSVAVVPVDGWPAERVERLPNRYRIVSVGRLCKWKTYNTYMIDVIADLRARGHPVRWDVYGTGELELEMRRRIKDSGLDNEIQLHGDLNLERFPEVMATAGVFVGMGTAIIDAAFCRVPGVIAIANSINQASYGYLYDLPFGSFGEELDIFPVHTTTELIQRLLVMADDEYQVEMERTWHYVQPYATDKVYEQLQVCIDRAQASRTSRWRFAAYNMHGMYRRLCQSRQQFNL